MQAQICTSQIQITRMPFCLRLDEIVRWIKCVFHHLKTVQRPQIYRYLFNSFERLQYQYGLIDKVAQKKETIVFKSVWILTMQQQSKFKKGGKKAKLAVLSGQKKLLPTPFPVNQSDNRRGQRAVPH